MVFVMNFFTNPVRVSYNYFLNKFLNLNSLPAPKLLSLSIFFPKKHIMSRSKIFDVTGLGSLAVDFIGGIDQWPLAGTKSGQFHGET
jgi:hypothetical protein